jgi:hypothetical protein
MARVLAVVLMAMAFLQAGALDIDSEEDSDRPKGARRRARERAMKAQLTADLEARGCAVLGDKKYTMGWSTFEVKQDGCKISFPFEGKMRSGTVEGTKVKLEEPFPEGEVQVSQNIQFVDGKEWVRK